MSDSLLENRDDMKKADKDFPVCGKIELTGEENYPQKIYDIVCELAVFFYGIENKSEENKS